MKHNEKQPKIGLSRSLKSRAFTLVEVLGATAIIAIVATLAIFSVAGSYEASQRAAIDKQEMELNRAWQHFISQGGSELHTVESGLAALAGTIDIGSGIIQGPWIPDTSIIPRELPVGEVMYTLTFLGKEWRYRPQWELPVETETPTPVPTPEATPDERPEYTVTVLDSEWGGGAYSRLAGDYKVREGEIFSIIPMPAPDHAFSGWNISNWDWWTDWNFIYGQTNFFVVMGDQTLTGFFQYSPQEEEEPTPTPTPEPTPEPTPNNRWTITIDRSQLADEWSSLGLNPASTWTVVKGQTTAITAMALNGFRFAGFNGLPSGATVTIDALGQTKATWTPTADITIQPVSVAQALLVRSIENGTAASSITALPAPQSSSWMGDSYDWGTTVTITANPAPGFIFKGWKGAVVSSANPATVTLDVTAKTVIAEFAPE